MAITPLSSGNDYYIKNKVLIIAWQWSQSFKGFNVFEEEITPIFSKEN
jgi:hypothetical protein